MHKSYPPAATSGKGAPCYGETPGQNAGSAEILSLLECMPGRVTLEPPSEPQSYEHRYLDYKTGQIRLIEILPDDNEDGQIRCRTQVYDLRSKPRFVALSYTWGSPPAQHTIEIDGERFLVRKNLWRFLRQAGKLSVFAGELFWIDAICINQNNLGERTHQVGLMPQIYKGAYKVLVWLGQAYEFSDEAMDYLSRSRRTGKSKSSLPRVWSTVCGMAIGELCARPYWKRLWVFQELLLAQQIEVMCGHKVIAWKPFQEFLLNTSRSTAMSQPVERVAYRSTVSSSAKTMAAHAASDSKERSLISLILGTQGLRCTEIRDKVYGLLGAATDGHRGIVADYGLPIEVLLGRVLGEHFASRTPTKIAQIRSCLDRLSDAFGVGVNRILKLHNGYIARKPVPPNSYIEVLSKALGPNAELFLWAYFYDYKPILRSVIDGVSPDLFRETFLQSVNSGNEHVTSIMLIINSEVTTLSFLNKNRAFIHAASMGRVRIVRAFIRFGQIDINVKDANDDTALRLAAANGHEEVVKILFDTDQADVNDLNYAFYFAVGKGHLAVVTAMINTGRIDINKRMKTGKTALEVAVRSGNAAIITALANPGAKGINRKKSNGHFTLHSDTESGRISCISGNTALHYAASTNNISAAASFLSSDKVDINVQNDQGETALHLAAMYRDTLMFKLILSTGRIDVNKRNKDGYTVLEVAAACSCTDIVKALLDDGRVDVNNLNNDGYTALHYAARDNDMILADMLMGTGKVNVNIKNKDGNTALHLAAIQRHMAVLTKILDAANVDVNEQDKDGHTVLGIAAARGYTELVKALIDDGRVDINGWNKNGYTALHFAADDGNLTLVNVLVKSDKIDVNIRSQLGCTALHIAALKHHTAVLLALLGANNVNVNIQDCFGNTALHTAAEHEHFSIVNALLGTGKIDNDLKNAYGSTALQTAKRRGQIAVVATLSAHKRVDKFRLLEKIYNRRSRRLSQLSFSRYEPPTT